jgi:putative transposase
MKIRDGAVASRPVYVAVGIDLEGDREVLGLWVGDGGEDAKHWMSVLAELRNRGVEDVLVVCCDRLKGLPESIGEIWPQALVQLCVVHLVRVSLMYSAKQHWGPIAKALRAVCTAPTVEAAERQFGEFRAAWGASYPMIMRTWESAREQFTPFLAFPPEIRRVIYTTNMIE